MAIIFNRRLRDVYRACTCNRSFVTSGIFRKNRLGQRARVLEKLLISTKKGATKMKSNEKKEKTVSNLLAGVPGPVARESRRQSVLNAIFLDRVTDLMSTGRLGPELAGYGIEINRVSVTRDFTLVQVFWAASGSSKDDTVQELLNKHSGILRAEIANLVMLGTVPRIHFVKDIQHSRLLEVEHLLKVADVGRDEFEVITTNEDEPTLQVKSDSPVMRMDIMKLDHEALMTKVKKKLNRMTSRPTDIIELPSGETEAKSPSNVQEFYSDGKDIAKFLKERRVKLKKQKQESLAKLEFVPEQSDETSHYRSNDDPDEDDVIDDNLFEDDLIHK